jgi:hypothetical protein
VQFTFDVDGTTVEFSRNWFTGRCTLHTGTRDEVLQSSLNPFMHYSMKLKRQWHFSVGDHAVIIEKERPLLDGGDFHGYRRAETGAPILKAPIARASDFNDRRGLLFLGLHLFRKQSAFSAS